MGGLYIQRIKKYVFISLVVVSVLISVPVRNKLVKFAGLYINSLSNQIKQRTGLQLSYTSLSPSLLSNFSMRGISFVDENGRNVLSIRRIKIDYKIFSLLRGDIQNGIKNFLIDGIDIDADRFLEICSRIEIEGTEKKLPSSEGIASDEEFSLSDFVSKLPQSIRLKNINLNYNSSSSDISVLLKDVSFFNNPKKHIVNYQINSRLIASFLAINKSFSCRLNVSGNILDNLKSSSMNLNLLDFTDGDMMLHRINFHAVYDSNHVYLNTVQPVSPVSLDAVYDIASKDLAVTLLADGLKPYSLGTIHSKQQMLESTKEFSITTTTHFTSNLGSRTFSFDSDGKFYLPESIFPQGALITYNINGDEKHLSLNNFMAEGPGISSSAKFSYKFDKSQLSGYFQLPYFVLKNGNVVSTEFYFDPLEKGFLAFSPQVFLGQKMLTALQLTFLPQTDSYDFVFEMYDYEHSEDGSTGKITIDGSYLISSRYLQTSISLNSVFLDSIVRIGAETYGDFVKNFYDGNKDFLSQIMATTDMYFSTDLKTFSYNVPVAVFVNTKKENQVLMLAMNGNEQSTVVDQLSVVSGNYALEASCTLDRNLDSSDKFFTADISMGSVPYHFAGTIMPEVVTVSGDYGFDFEIRKTGDDFAGHAVFENLPLSLGKKSLVFSTESTFSSDKQKGPSVQVSRFEVEFADASVSVVPRLVFSGNISRYGAQLPAITYTDFYSALQGSADVVLNINDSVFDSAAFMLKLKNPLNDESVSVDASVSNPDMLPFDFDTFVKNFYINSQVQLNRFSLNRYTVQKSDDNYVTGNLFVAGTIENPYAALNLEEASVLIASTYLGAKGVVVLEDKSIDVDEFKVNYGNLKIHDTKAHFSLENLEGSATSYMENQIADQVLNVPLKIEVSNSIKTAGTFLPDSFTATLSSDNVSGGFIKKPFGFSISLMRSGGNYTVFSSDNVGLYGSYLSTGETDFTWNNKEFINANLLGILRHGEMSLSISDLNVDLKKLFAYINLDSLVSVENGILDGSVNFTGSVDDPDINGQLSVKNPQARVPIIFPEKVYTDMTYIDIVHNDIYIREALYAVKRGSQRLKIDCSMYLNKWALDRLEANFVTAKKEVVPATFSTNEFTVSGEVGCALNLAFEKNTLNVTGQLNGDKVELTSNLSRVSGHKKIFSEDMFRNLKVACDLSAVLGNHSTLNFNPWMRCVLVPGSSFRIRSDGEEYFLEGEIDVKSGDITYLGRNFYIKSGRVKFNTLDIMNPLVSLRAETREKDSNNQNVSIICTIDNQYLQSLNPRFSSIPAKSEVEIQALLGQIAIGGNEKASGLLYSAGDFFMQSTVLRQFENKLRDLLNFDIFSVRANVIQNTLNLGLSGEMQKDSVSVGNLLDNSTVYIGKYLGSNLYVDAMVRASFEDEFGGKTSAGQLVFRPEIGLELESPFVNIRWNMAPNLYGLKNNQFVPSTSVTLSWKFTF